MPGNALDPPRADGEETEAGEELERNHGQIALGHDAARDRDRRDQRRSR